MGSAAQKVARWIEPYALLLPTAVLVALVSVYPLAYLFYVSLHATSYFALGAWSGLANFTDLFASDAGRQSLIASFVFVIVSDVVVAILGLGLAIVMEAPMRGRGALRTLMMVPWLVSEVVVALLWQAMLNAEFGPIPAMLGSILHTRVDILGTSNGAMTALIVANVWRSYPFAFILFLAALQGVPEEIYEAAQIDGASRFEQLRHIVLPHLMGTIMVVMILMSFQFLTLVTLSLILTGGGPNGTTYVLPLRIWRQAFEYYNFGTASAAGVVLFLLNMILSAIYLRRFVAPAR